VRLISVYGSRVCLWQSRWVSLKLVSGEVREAALQYSPYGVYDD
jgi:hypothetical protein